MGVNQSSSISSRTPKSLESWWRQKRDHLISKGFTRQDAEDAVQNGYLKLMNGVKEEVVEEDGTVTKPLPHVTKGLLASSTQQAIVDALRRDGSDALCRERGVKTRSEQKRDAERDKMRQRGVSEDEVLQFKGTVAKDITAGSTDYQAHVEVDMDGNLESIQFEDTNQDSQFEETVAEDFMTACYDRLNKLYGRYPEKYQQSVDLLNLQLQGYGRNEIADMQGLSPNTIKNRLTQQRKDLAPVREAVFAKSPLGHGKKVAVGMPNGCYIRQ